MKEFEVPLVVTTPFMKGQKVADAQYLLKGNNRFTGLAPLKDQAVDKVYGPVTGQATKRAKFWLGYPLPACDMVFGQTLYEFLRTEHWRPLPDAYRARRDARIAAAVETPGMKAIRLAEQELGYQESPFGSNRTKFGVEYGFNGVAWCAIFESIMFKHANFPSFRYSYVGNIHHDAVANRNHLRRVYTPTRGDVVCYSLHGDPFAHTAFFDAWHVPGRDFWDIGGNTSAHDFSNGGEVARQIRSTSIVTSYVRVG